MVKKLFCEVIPSDWVRVVTDSEGIAVQVRAGGEKTYIFLTISDAKKLRKQIKKALAKIVGEPEDDIVKETEEPEYIPHVGEVVEVYRNTKIHQFPIGERIRVTDVDNRTAVKAEYLDGRGSWLVGGDIRPIQNWKPEEGEKVLIVDSTFVMCGGSRSWVGKFGYVSWSGGDGVCKIYNEGKSDYYGFNLSDLRPAE